MMRPYRIIVLPILALIVIASACGGENPPPGETTTSDVSQAPQRPSAPGGSAGSSTAPDDPAPSETLCESAAQLGDVIQEDVFQTEGPSLVGGPLTPGTYLLAGMTLFAGNAPSDAGDPESPGPSGVYGRGTITIFATGAIRITSSRGTDKDGLPASTTEGFTFTEADASVARVCPAPGPSRVLSYSASGAGLVIAPDGAHQEKYVRY